MINLKNEAVAWPDKFLVMENHEDIPLDRWWNLYSHELANLNKEICEQWIYRHGGNANYKFLPLDKLAWGLEQWETDKIINSVGIWDDNRIVDEGHTYCSAEHDFNIYNEIIRNPFHSLRETGTWNTPILLLHSPEGFITYKGKRPDIHYWLVEGHSRIRYLNALQQFGKLVSHHSVYILTWTKP